MATVAAHGLLVALRTAGEVRDDGRARKTDGGVGVRLEVGEERLDGRAGDLLEVDSLGLKSVVSMQGEQTTEQRQLTDWTELQHWSEPVEQSALASRGAGVATARTATARGAKAESLENMLREVLCRSY